MKILSYLPLFIFYYCSLNVESVYAQNAYILKNSSNSVSVLRLSDNVVIKEIQVGSNPIFATRDEKNNRVYVVNSGSNDISVISTLTNQVIDLIPLNYIASAQYFYGVAISPDAKNLYASEYKFGNGNTILLIDVQSHSIKKQISVGGGPSEIIMTRDGGKIYVANGTDNTISEISTITNSIVRTFSSGGTRPRDMLLSNDEKTLYVANAVSNQVAIINLTTTNIESRINVGQQPLQLALTKNGQKLYVSCFASNNLYAIDLLTQTVSGSIGVGTNPLDIALSSDECSLYVININSGDLMVVSTTTNLIKQNVQLGNSPRFVLLPDIYNTCLIPTSDIEILNTIKLSPNPGNDIVTLDIPEDITIKNVKITDAQGRILMTISENQRKFSTASLPKGLYFVNVFTNTQKVSVLKWIKAD